MNKNKVTITVELNDLSSEKKTGELASFFTGLAASMKATDVEVRTFTNEGKGYKTMADSDAANHRAVEESEKALRDCVPPDFTEEVKVGKFIYRRIMRKGKESFIKLGGKRPTFINKDAFSAKTNGKKLKRTYTKAKPKPPKAKKAKPNMRRKRRTPEQIKKIQGLIVDDLSAGHGPTKEELAVALNKNMLDLNAPMKKLIEGNWVRTSGHTRATRYFLTRKKWS